MRRLHHDHAERGARDQPVAAGKVAGARLVAERHLRDRGTLAVEDRCQQIAMLRRIDAVMAAGEHGDGAALDAGAVRGLVDAAGEAGDDDKAGFAKLAGELTGEFQACTGGIARADDRDHRPHQRCDVAAHGKQRRRIVERCQPGRIAVLAGREPGDAELAARGELGFRLVGAADARRSLRAAAACEIRQPLQRGARRAEMIDQRPERARPDIVGADQPQAVDPVGLGQLHAWIDGVHGGSLQAQHGTT